jgi:hypothetical protein
MWFVAMLVSRWLAGLHRATRSDKSQKSAKHLYSLDVFAFQPFSLSDWVPYFTTEADTEAVQTPSLGLNILCQEVIP